jgi:clan AA aspartic protease
LIRCQFKIIETEMKQPNPYMIYAELDISNPREQGLSALKINALVDTGSRFMLIPEHVALQLKLEPSPNNPHREVTLADGSSRLVPYVGPIYLKFQNRSCFTGALVMGDEPIIGLVAMGDMDLVVFTEEKRLAVNPDSPNIAMAYAKGFTVKTDDKTVDDAAKVNE